MNNRSLRMTITVNSSQPELLEGLEVWLRLGLISDSQVKQLSQTYLTCPLPQALVVVSDAKTTLSNSEIDFAPEDISQVTPILTPQKKNFIILIWQAFKDELSVRWLLFLGLFLVVISSGVLAATQWVKFPAAGQYLILWVYTLIFWGIGFWASQRENLQLTSQTLQTITLLLIPVNFWAMDTFGLWRSPGEWLTVALSSLSLTGICFLQNKSQRNLLLFVNFLGLSYLHWGWQLPSFSLIAVYIGTITTVIILRFLTNSTQLRGDTTSIKIGYGFVVYALSVLLIRAVFVVHLPLGWLGLAIGVCGWLLQKENIIAHSPISTTLEIIGVILLFLGWWISVEEFPWQAIIISGLALQFFAHRLQRNGLRLDILAIFIIGLQALLLIGELIPNEFRQAIVTFWVQISHPQASPESIYSLTLFPHIIFWIWLTHWLYRQEKPKLASFGEWLTLGLGVVLTLISLSNPIARSLNLFLSTATLTYVIFRRFPTKSSLFYLTNILYLLTICSTIDWWFPAINRTVWASLLLILMVAEWGVSTRQNLVSESLAWQQIWYRSCWHIGFVLAALSYILLWDKTEKFILSQEGYTGGLLWLTTPLTLTVIASRTIGNRRLQATSFSCGALGLLQSLTLWQFDIRLIGLGVATGLMWLNSYYSPYLIIAIIQIGFTFGFITALLWGKLALSSWFLLIAIAIFVLWLLHTLLRRWNNTLAVLYAQATDGWASTLCVIALILLTCKFFYYYPNFPEANWRYPVTAILISSAILYRSWRYPNNQAVYSLTWAIELGIIEVILLLNGSTLALATINIFLALFALLITTFLLTKRLLLSQLISIKILPLVIALIAITWRWGDFNAYTGLITLGAALIGIGVGYRLRKGKIITYFSVATISFACYELIIYQLSKAPEVSPADRLTILAVVTATIALIYRIFAAYWRSRRHDNFLNIKIAEIEITAHIHWAIGSILKLLTAVITINSTLSHFTPISIVTGLILAAYALVQGRYPEIYPEISEENKTSHWWVYVGLVEIAATAIYARSIWIQLSILDPFRVIIISVFAIVIYQMPWRSLGWQSTPWHRAAIVMPALAVLVTIDNVSYLSLLIVAAFYARLAIRQRNIRWSYISLGFLDWAIARFLLTKNLLD
ncbi:MAG: hypothetical protein ACRDEA_00190, partial [Microcystaceae cyanobacterium]